MARVSLPSLFLHSNLAWMDCSLRVCCYKDSLFICRPAVVSAFDPPPSVVVSQQAFASPYPITAMDVTRTLNGITPKHVIRTDLNRISMLLMLS
jgi:hypothetical protein